MEIPLPSHCFDCWQLFCSLAMQRWRGSLHRSSRCKQNAISSRVQTNSQHTASQDVRQTAQARKDETGTHIKYFLICTGKFGYHSWPQLSSHSQNNLVLKFCFWLNPHRLTVVLTSGINTSPCFYNGKQKVISDSPKIPHHQEQCYHTNRNKTQNVIQVCIAVS